MTKKEKLEKLLKGEDLDSLDFFRPILMNFAAHSIGKKYSDFASDYRVLVEANLRCLELFDMDAVGLISDPYRESSAFGATISYPEDSVPVCKPIISSIADVQELKIPDVFSDLRTKDRLKAIDEYRKHLQGDVPVIGWVEGPLAEAADLAGVSDMLIYTLTDPDFVHALLKKTTAFAKIFAQAQIDAGCDIIGIGDAICSQISAEQFQTIEKQYLDDLIKYIQSKGALVKLHICGDITHLLPDIKDLKPDILDLDWLVDMEEAYQVVGKDIIRCGNINPVDIQDKTAEEIYAQTRKLCEQEKGRKFILSGGCEITILTKHENLKAMKEAQRDVYRV